MKNSVFSQRWEIIGKFGKVSGQIVVTMNHKSENRIKNNPSTHDQSDVTVYVHKILGLVNDKEWMCVDNLETEKRVLDEVMRYKELMNEYMDVIANAETPKDFTSKMFELGFKTDWNN